MPAVVSRLDVRAARAQIAERLELFAGAVPPGGSEPQWTRLGSIGLDPNERSGFQARLPLRSQRVLGAHWGRERLRRRGRSMQTWRVSKQCGKPATTPSTAHSAACLAARCVHSCAAAWTHCISCLQWRTCPSHRLWTSTACLSERAGAGAGAEDGGPARGGQPPALCGARLPCKCAQRAQAGMRHSSMLRLLRLHTGQAAAGLA